jgi:hypothetical protein
VLGCLRQRVEGPVASEDGGAALATARQPATALGAVGGRRWTVDRWQGLFPGGFWPRGPCRIGTCRRRWSERRGSD